jgi:hypothetical protein
MKEFKFTPENLFDNLDRLGGWSMYALAEEAMFHYFPNLKRIKSPGKQIQRMCEISNEYGMDWWIDWIILYHLDVGYKNFNSDYVNGY